MPGHGEYSAWRNNGGSYWPKLFRGPDAPWPTPHVPDPIDPDANGVVLLCWRLPRGGGTAAANRITRWPDLYTAVPCPCGPKCEGRHALVFADHGRVRVRSVQEPPVPSLADELREWELYRKRRSSGLWPKDKRVSTVAAPTPPTPRRVPAMPPQREIPAAAEPGGNNRAAYTNPEPQVETSPNDWRQRWARKPLATTG